MNDLDYQPSPLADVDARAERDRWTLVFHRDLPHPPEKVWDALTDPSQLHQWAPFDADRNVATVNDATFTMAGAPTPERQAVVVRTVEPPKLLEYVWGTDVLRWELEARDGGTRLTLRHTIDDLTWIPRVAAGWHICLDVADRLIAGRPIGRIVADDARRYGWDDLNTAYAVRLGIPNKKPVEEADKARTSKH